MVFDRFKSWRNSQVKGVICPSCQHSNQDGARICTRCYYQIDRAAFEQSSSLGDGESTDLLDELMSEIEIEEGSSEEAIPPSFALDDLTVEVAQYGDDDQIALDIQPDLGSISNPPEIVEDEDYELTAADIPQFVNKFEVPVVETEEPVSEHRTIDLIHPNAETPDHVQQLPENEIAEVNGWGKQNDSEVALNPADFDGDGKVDEFEEAFAGDQIQKTPVTSIPRISATPITNGSKPTNSREHVFDTPSAQIMEFEGSENSTQPSYVQNQSFWPWHQQEEWAAAEIIKQLQAAIRSAKEQNIAQATVLLDEVGPHLGNRTTLVYSVGRLLISIGRTREAEMMVESAFKANPDDPDVARARDKLIS